MWNLFKNTFRSFNKNKVSLIGLCFLTFLATSVFTLFNSISTGISKEYDNIQKQGNLHDFTVSENYNIGKVSWNLVTDEDDPNWSTGTSSDDKTIMWAKEQTGSGTNWSRTYCYDVTIDDMTSELGQFINNHPTGYDELFHPTITISSTQQLNYLNNSTNHHATETYDICMSELSSAGDISQTQTSLSSLTNELVNLATTIDTPMEQYLQSQKNDFIQDFRYFKSIDINNSSDNILYKVIQMDGHANVDTQITFKNEDEFSNSNHNNYDPLDDNPFILTHDYDQYILNQGQFIGINNILKWDVWDTTLPDKQLECFFKTLALCNIDGISTAGGKDVILYLGSHSTTDSDWNTNFNRFKSELGKPAIFDKTSRITYLFNTTLHDTLYLDNWTSFTAIATPKYAEQAHKQVMTSKYFESDPSYQNFINTHPQANNLSIRQRFSAWFSTLTSNEYKTFLTNLPQDIKISIGGGAPYVLLNFGITPDFIYPIIDLAHMVPNPNNECILYVNQCGWQTTYLSYQSDHIDSYLVGKFKDGIDQEEALNKINNEASQIMSWPKGTQAAYFKDDINNHFNASAFRIVFVPNLVHTITLVCNTLTIFIILLATIVCWIIIGFIVSRTKTIIGVMRANGYRKREIILSLLPLSFFPTIFGGAIGYIVGFLLQTPGVGLLKAYWMLPTITIGFTWWVMLLLILIPFIFFCLVTIIATLINLKEDIPTLMKNGGEFKVNKISRAIVSPFSSLNIISRFRLSLAFNSMLRTALLTVLFTISFSMIGFGIAINNKFAESAQQTYNSRNYTFAVDLASVTSQQGQYAPISSDQFGQSGFIQTSQGTTWVPNNYYYHYFNDDDSTLKDQTFHQLFGAAPTEDDYETYYGIAKNYYNITYEVTDLIQEYEGYIPKSIMQPAPDGNTIVHGLQVYPTASDSLGQAQDIQYLHNRTLNEDTMNYLVGLGALSSNPWNIVLSLLPENQRILIESRYNHIWQQIGEAVVWGAIDSCRDDQDQNPYNTQNANALWEERTDPKSKYVQFFNIKTCSETTDRIDPICPYNFSLDVNKAVASNLLGVCLNQDLLKLINKAYDYFHTSDQPNTPLVQQDFSVIFNSVPLGNNDETYTYLTTDDNNGQNKIIGVKDNSNYVKLRDENGKDILPLISSDRNTPNQPYPLIVNAYAAYQHNFHVGQVLSFNVTNDTTAKQREIDQIATNQTQPKNIVQFQIVGEATTYQGSEYFTNQDAANAILGLRVSSDQNYLEHIKYHNYFVNTTMYGLLYQPWGQNVVWREKEPYNYPDNLFWDLAANQNHPNDQKVTGDNPLLDYIKNGEALAKINPVGFNGYFTNNPKGGNAISASVPVYTPTGISPGNSQFDSTTVKNILKIGNNLYMAAVFTGLYDPNNPTKYSDQNWIGNKIHDSWSKWFTTNTENDFDVYASDSNINQFIGVINQVFGNTTAENLVINAVDRDSSHLIFDNLSQTIHDIEYITIAIIVLMCIIIIFLIAIMLIQDARMIAARLKALGYSDKSNTISFLSSYFPILTLGSILGIAGQISFIYIFRYIVFKGANILLTVSFPWWTFLIAASINIVILFASCYYGYLRLRRSNIPDELKL